MNTRVGDHTRCRAVAVSGLAPVLLVGICLQACGSYPPQPSETSTHTLTPADNFVPTAVVGSISSLHMFDATTGWAATYDRALRTTDGGLHWRDVTPPAPSGPSLPSLAVFPRSASEAWVARGLDAGGPGASESALSHTTDGGQTWRLVTLPVFAVAQITFADATHGWMLADVDTAHDEQGVDIFRTTDEGQTWAKVASATNQPGALPLQGRKTGLTFRDAHIGWATGAGPLDAVQTTAKASWLFTTHDGGATWQQQPLALPTSLAQYPWFYVAGVLPATFFSPDLGVLPVAVGSQAAGGAVASFVYVTRNGGATWAPTAPVQSVPDATSLPDPSHWWIAADRDATCACLFSTADGGQHWATLSPGAPFDHVAVLSFVSDVLGWAIGSAGLLCTDDGAVLGRSWLPHRQRNFPGPVATRAEAMRSRIIEALDLPQVALWRSQ